MEESLEDISLVARREIEVRMVAPLLDAMASRCDHALVLDMLARVVKDLGRQSGRETARRVGGDSLAHLAQGISLWSRGGALELEHLDHAENRLFFDVHRCRYAEMYQRLGLAELGLIMSCSRDFAFARGFNPRLRLRRNRTIMAGQGHCDFRFFLEGKESDEP